MIVTKFQIKFSLNCKNLICNICVEWPLISEPQNYWSANNFIFNSKESDHSRRGYLKRLVIYYYFKIINKAENEKKSMLMSFKNF